jgi:hypothetical protein
MDWKLTRKRISGFMLSESYGRAIVRWCTIVAMVFFGWHFRTIANSHTKENVVVVPPAPVVDSSTTVMSATDPTEEYAAKPAAALDPQAPKVMVRVVEDKKFTARFFSESSRLEVDVRRELVKNSFGITVRIGDMRDQDPRLTPDLQKISDRFFEIEGITNVEFKPFRINVQKAKMFEWAEFHDRILVILREEFPEKEPVVDISIPDPPMEHKNTA